MIFSNTSIKLYPSCRYSHLFIKSALELRKQFNLEDIDKIVISVNETANMLCHPLEDRVQPTTIQDAKFSIPFMVAFAFVYGSVNLNNITESALSDFRVLDLAKRIRLRNSHINSLGIPPGDIAVYSSSEVRIHSESQAPQVTSEQVKLKFIECCQFAHIDNPELLYEMLIKNMDYELVNILPIIE